MAIREFAAGELDNACDAYLRLLRRDQSSFNRNFHTISRPFEQEGRLGDLADLMMEVGLAKFRDYRVAEICRDLVPDGNLRGWSGRYFWSPLPSFDIDDEPRETADAQRRRSQPGPSPDRIDAVDWTVKGDEIVSGRAETPRQAFDDFAQRRDCIRRRAGNPLGRDGLRPVPQRGQGLGESPQR